MKLNNIMPMRYWILTVFVILSSIFNKFVFGDSLKSLITLVPVIVMFGFLFRSEKNSN